MVFCSCSAALLQRAQEKQAPFPLLFGEKWRPPMLSRHGKGMHLQLRCSARLNAASHSCNEVVHTAVMALLARLAQPLAGVSVRACMAHSALRSAMVGWVGKWAISGIRVRPQRLRARYRLRHKGSAIRVAP